MKLKVLKVFKDKEDHTTKNVGDTLCISDLARINKMVKVGACEIISIEDDPTPGVADKATFQEKEYDLELLKNALGEIGVAVAANAKVKGITNAIEKLTEEQALALSEKLNVEE